VTSVRGETLMLASSQGDSSFHFYLIGRNVQHLGSFFVDGVGDTDGVHYVPVPLGKQYPLGLLVVQNGDAPLAWFAAAACARPQSRLNAWLAAGRF